MAERKSSLTEGAVAKGLFLFALPLLGSSLIQQLYNTVDLIFVGNFLGKGGGGHRIYHFDRQLHYRVFQWNGNGCRRPDSPVLWRREERQDQRNGAYGGRADPASL